MAFWNLTETSHPGPPINTGKVSIPAAEVRNLQEVFVNASAILQDLYPLHVEAAMLSRSMYRKKNSYHTDKGFQKLKTVNRALMQYHAMDFAAIYNKFSNTLPIPEKRVAIGRLQADTDIYMPTRQMLEWVLVRTQGFARLFCGIAQSCEDTSCFWMARLRKGHTYNYSVVILAILGRIWTYAKYLTVKACEWYAELKPYLAVLKPMGIAWAPNDYTFPDDLKVWLNAPHITTDQQVSKPDAATAEMNKVFDMFGLSSNAEDKTFPRDLDDKRFEVAGAVDVGEVISREELAMDLQRNHPSAADTNFKKTKKQKKSKLSSMNISSKHFPEGITNNEQSLVVLKKKKKKIKNLENCSKEASKISLETHKDEREDQLKKKKKKKITFETNMEQSDKVKEQFKKQKKNNKSIPVSCNNTSEEKLLKLLRLQQKKKKKQFPSCKSPYPVEKHLTSKTKKAKDRAQY